VARFEITLLPGARELFELHARELPQRDDLCGAFCGALALRAAGVLLEPDGAPLDQDAVALAAGSVVCAMREAGTLPLGEVGRRDYRVQIPVIDDEDVSGTTAAGVQEAITELSGGSVVALALAGPWTAASLAGLFDLLAAREQPVALIANHATHHLWGSHPTAVQLLEELEHGDADGPPPDWDVGHFACVAGCISGARGRLYVLADTYPALGSRGVHLQPGERLAAAIDRRDKPAGGMLVVARAEDAESIRRGVRSLGFEERMWDNGSVTAGTLR